MRFAVLLALALCVRGADFYLHPNDTVVFYGDSITDQRLYTTYVETFVVTRYPKLPVRFVHSGWGGDRVTGGGGGPIDDRLKRDVLLYKPTVMTIMLGMNDGRYRAFDDDTFRVFTDGYEHIVKSMKDAVPNLRITLIDPSPYDDVTRAPLFDGGYNAVLLKYGEYLRTLAERNQLDFADLNTRLVKALERANATDPAIAQKIVPDRVHPHRSGHLLMAASLLESWGASPIVTRVEIDASSAQVKDAVNTSVSDLDTKTSIHWMQKDDALPMPLPMNDPVMTLAVESSDFREKFNRETLRVTGLIAPSYVLKINGRSIGVFTRENLAAGINLAELDTPMMQQAAQVHDLTIKRADIHNIRWRQVQLPLQNMLPARAAAVEDNLDALDNDLAAIQRATAQPASCLYELNPVP
ncbi:MAG TPA: SGNH/GDSL hydrolase family protein [Bryobacteraceae bacterium]|nr:SGNH/GDSL hydrolase family protein [Bryobacteraceae bacterium]